MKNISPNERKTQIKIERGRVCNKEKLARSLANQGRDLTHFNQSEDFNFSRAEVSMKWLSVAKNFHICLYIEIDNYDKKSKLKKKNSLHLERDL